MAHPEAGRRMHTRSSPPSSGAPPPSFMERPHAFAPACAPPDSSDAQKSVCVAGPQMRGCLWGAAVLLLVLPAALCPAPTWQCLHAAAMPSCRLLGSQNHSMWRSLGTLAHLMLQSHIHALLFLCMYAGPVSDFDVFERECFLHFMLVCHAMGRAQGHLCR